MSNFLSQKPKKTDGRVRKTPERLAWERAEEARKTKVFIETLDAIEGAFLEGAQSFASIFRDRKDAEALWVKRPGDIEPFRLPWYHAIDEHSTRVTPRDGERAEKPRGRPDRRRSVKSPNGGKSAKN